MAAETARLIASLELQDKNFTRGLKQVERGVGRVDKKLGAFSGAVNRNVGRAVDNVTARLMEVPGQVISAAVEQEAAITGIAKTINGDISGIVDDLKRLSTETGSTFTELAGIAELGGAMGIAKDDVAAFTEQVAILGATTDVSVEDAATALGQLQNVIGLTGDEFDNFAATLVDLGNKGASTESQILEIAKRSGAAARLFHISKNDTLAWASAVANLGINAEAGGTALASLFQKSLPLFLKGNKTIQKVTGKTAKELKQAFEKDAGAALQSFIGDLSELSEGDRLAAIQKLYGKNSALTKILLGLSGDTDNLTESVETGTKAWEDATAAQAEADKRFATSEFLFKRLNNSVNLAAATVGTELLPVLNDLATEGLAFLSKPATQKGIKDFAVGLGKGIRGLAAIVTSINWGAVAGFLSTAAGFAGQLVTWFTKMPDWAQAFLIGGFVATKLPVIGDLFSSLASGLIKGVLGINAGIVNVNGPVAGGGVGGAAGAAGGTMGKIMSAVRILGAVTIAGASIALLAQTFQDFAKGVGESQKDLLTKVNNTSRQGFKETIANLEATNKGIQNMNPLENVLAGIFGGSEITRNFELAASRIVGDLQAGNLSRADMVKALQALQETRETNPVAELPQTDRAIKDLTAAIKASPAFKGAPGAARPKAPINQGGAPGAFRPVAKEITAKQQATINAVKNAQSIASRENSAQRTELSNIKNATVTGAAQQQATLLAQTAVNAAGNMLSVFQSASQVLAAQGTTTAANNTTVAARGAGNQTSSAMASAASRIVSAVNALDLSVNVTTVNRTSTVNNRYGPSGGSSTTERAGGNTG